MKRDNPIHGAVAFVLILAALICLVRWTEMRTKSQGCSPRDDSCAVGCP